MRSLKDMLDNIQSQRETVVDARSAGRFKGRDPEPRPGLPSGHIPGSKSLPFTDLLLDGGRSLLCPAQNTASRCAAAPLLCP